MPLFFDYIMSKYEPRAEGIKEIAKDYGWKISWKKQGRYVYATLTQRRPLPESRKFLGIRSLMHTWYPGLEMTSVSSDKITYRVFDVWKAIGGK
jgi:hypothetical protein